MKKLQLKIVTIVIVAILIALAMPANVFAAEANMQVVKAGESHGKAMVGILTGVPAGITVDKRKINLKDSIKAYGKYNVEIKVHPEVVAKFTVHVHE